MPAAATRSREIQDTKAALAAIPAHLLSVRAVATFLGTTPGGLVQMVRRGQFPEHHCKVGREKRWRKLQILDWIIERKESK